tara:strand:- start:873 stop:1118 length:246 start_codon:yes stop_codon:yes gene_type:complete
MKLGLGLLGAVLVGGMVYASDTAMTREETLLRELAKTQAQLAQAQAAASGCAAQMTYKSLADSLAARGLALGPDGSTVVAK